MRAVPPRPRATPQPEGVSEILSAQVPFRGPDRCVADRGHWRPSWCRAEDDAIQVLNAIPTVSTSAPAAKSVWVVVATEIPQDHPRPIRSEQSVILWRIARGKGRHRAGQEGCPD